MKTPKHVIMILLSILPTYPVLMLLSYLIETANWVCKELRVLHCVQAYIEAVIRKRISPRVRLHNRVNPMVAVEASQLD